MSVIKTETVEIGGKPYTKQIRYFSTERKFSIEVPEEIATATNHARVAGDTEKEVDEAFNRVISEFAALKHKTDKVILYRIDLKAKIVDAQGKVLFDQGGLRGDRDTEVSFQYLVATRFRWGGTSEYFNEQGEKVWIGGESIMEWTAEREQFFAAFKSSLETAILRAHKFFKNQKKLIKLIDTHAAPRLLEAPKS